MTSDFSIFPGYFDNSLFSNFLILSGLVGKVDFTVRHLSSATVPFPGTWSSFTSGQQCIGNGVRQVKENKLELCYVFFPLVQNISKSAVACFDCGSLVTPPLLQCSAFSGNSSSETTWTMRATFPEYVVALATIVGSVLFSVCLILVLQIS